jgi:GDP-4-dehydro-6-deoxy-D-mannose reductase
VKVVVTGADGFLGRHLSERLRGDGADVLALGRQQCDILDAARLKALVAEARPAQVFHLAAQSSPGGSWAKPAETFRVNVEGTLNVLEAVRAAGIDPVVLVAGSSSEYAMTEQGRPIVETDPQAPLTPYAASKVAAGQCAALYAERYRMKIVRLRPFFLIGPLKTGDVCSDLARRVVAVERGAADAVTVGRLEMVRDFLDVRDGVEAMALLARKGVAGEAYNICSGKGHSIAQILDGYRKLAARPIVDRTDPALLRSGDEPVRIGNPAKLEALGWRPRWPLEQSLAAILDYWRKAA